VGASYIEENLDLLLSSSAFRIETLKSFVIVDRGVNGDEVAF